MLSLKHAPRRSRTRRREFINTPIAPPERYFLTPAECASAIGVTTLTLARWRKTWANGQQGIGVEPVCFSPSIVRYRWDQVTNLNNDPAQPKFIDLMRSDLAKFVEATSAPTKSAMKTKAAGASRL